MNIKKLLAVIIGTALFPWLFYENYIGINLLIFNLLIFAGLYFTGKLNLKSNLNRSILLGTMLTAFFVVYNGSDLAVTVNIMSLFLLGSTSVNPKGRNLTFTWLHSIVNFFASQLELIILVKNFSSGTQKSNKFFRLFRLIIIPVAVVFLFVLIYKTANPVFEGMVKSFFDSIDAFFDWFFKNIELALLMTFVFGLMISNYFFLGNPFQGITEMEENKSDNLSRVRKKSTSKFKTTALKTEYTSAIILFALLNILILIT